MLAAIEFVRQHFPNQTFWVWSRESSGFQEFSPGCSWQNLVIIKMFAGFMELYIGTPEQMLT